jgi:hypothetical protein
MTAAPDAPCGWLPGRRVRVLAILWRHANARQAPPGDLPDIDLAFLGATPKQEETFPEKGTLAGDLMRAWTDALGPEPKDWTEPPETWLDVDDLTRQNQGLSKALTQKARRALVDFDARNRPAEWPERMRLLGLRAGALHEVLALRQTDTSVSSDRLEAWAIARIEHRYVGDLRLMDRARQARREGRLARKANQIAEDARHAFHDYLRQAQEYFLSNDNNLVQSDHLLQKLRRGTQITLATLLDRRELEAAQYLESLGRARMVIGADCTTRLMLPAEGRT